MTKYKGKKVHSNFSYKNFHPHHSYDQGHHQIYNSPSTTGRGFEGAVDVLAQTKHKPSLIHGDLTLLGKDTSVIKQLNQYKQPLQQKVEEQYSPPPVENQPIASNAQSETEIKALTIAVVGNKLRSSNYCCFLFTIASSILLFPLAIMLTNWWKRIVSPLYEVKSQFYQTLGSFLQRQPHCKKVTLTVVDNGFGVEKSCLLLSALQKSQVQTFTFLNRAFACHLHEQEGQKFRENVIKIKKLRRVESKLIWGNQQR